MDIWGIILNPVIGAIIGLFTNWIAIVMLFRPHNEVRIFGIKLPFTPGLIPKERYALSKKVGQTLSDKVLTEEVIIESLSKPEIKESVKSTIHNAVDNILTSEKTMREFLSESFVEDFDGLMTSAEKGAASCVSFALNNASFNKKLAELLASGISDFLKHAGNYITSDIVCDNIKIFVSEHGLPYLKSSEFKSFLREQLTKVYYGILESDKKIGDILPAEILDGLENAAKEKMPLLPDVIKKFLDDNPEFEKNLSALIAKVAAENAGTLVKIFINFDKIYGKIKENTLAYLRNPKNQEFLSEKLGLFIRNLAGQDLKMVIKSARLEDTDSNRESASSGEIVANSVNTGVKQKIDSLLDYALDGDFLQSAVSFLEGKKDKLAELNIYSWIEGFEPEPDRKIAEFIENNTLPLIREKIADNTPKFIHEGLIKLTDTKLCVLFSSVSKEGAESIKTFLSKTAEKLTTKLAAFAVRYMNITEIVEERINSFSVMEAEKLILDVVNKELTMITVLGGVLGFIIGFVPVLRELL